MTTYKSSDYRVFSGLVMDLSGEISIDGMDLDDFLISLSRMPRYNGQTTHSTITVAQHTIFVMRLLEQMKCNTNTRRMGYLHDWHEVITGDIVRPIKRRISGIEKLEADIDRQIFARYEIDVNQHAINAVTLADNLACQIEIDVLMEGKFERNDQHYLMLSEVLRVTEEDGGYWEMTEYHEALFNGS